MLSPRGSRGVERHWQKKVHKRAALVLDCAIKRQLSTFEDRSLTLRNVADKILDEDNVNDSGDMKLSVMQESSGDGVELPENRFNGIDEVIMDRANDSHSEDRNLGREEGSMVSNLPLLFANGYPTSLEKITMAQLERFVSFMVHCSLGHDTTIVIAKPQWWPQDVEFSNPLIRPRQLNDNWMANLKKLVFRCYTYHRSEYLLRFCSCLAQYPREELEYVNNWDSTTSLYHKSSGKLLVTFRNENMNYDKKKDSQRRTLLSHNGSLSSYANKVKQRNRIERTPMMVQPPCDDIYLCDNCDAEFVGLAKMKEHEKTCCEPDQGGSGSRSSTPEPPVVEPELQQHQFLEYFRLSSNKTEVKATSVNKNEPDNGIVRRTSRRVRGSVNFTRCATIPFSSPAGLVLAKKSKAMTEETQQERLDRIERHVIAPVLSNSCRPKWLDAEIDHDRWVVTYKQNRDKPNDGYVHQYRYIKSFRSKPMLSIQSQLLYIACRPIYAVLTRLSQKEIDELKQDCSKYQYPQNTNMQNVLLMRRSGPACKTRSRGASSKRKMPTGDESDPIVLEDDAALTANITKTLAAFAATESPADNAESAKLIRGKRSGSTNRILLIDLCSSDEEDDSNIQTPCDENKDPMNSESQIAKSFVRKLTPNNKLCAKPCIYPVTSSTDRLPNNILNEDKNENSTNKCRTGVLNECAHLSPMFTPAP